MSTLQQEIDTLKKTPPTLPEWFSRKDCLKLLDGDNSRRSLDCAFYWDKTPQEHQYWKSLAEAVGNGENLPKEALEYIKDLVILSYRQEQGE